MLLTRMPAFTVKTDAAAMAVVIAKTRRARLGDTFGAAAAGFSLHYQPSTQRSISAPLHADNRARKRHAVFVN
jgi:hypothetical protein